MLRLLVITLLQVACIGWLTQSAVLAEELQRPSWAAPVGPVAASPQRAGDPQAGYQALLNNAYVSCGIPYSAYRQAAPATADAETRLPGREGRNAELPYSLNSAISETGVELVVANCLTCHAGYFNGELVIGLGNEAADWTEDLVESAESIGLYVEGEAEAAEWRRWADRIAAIAPYSITDTVGVNPANNLTLALLMHHDRETLAWSEQPLLTPPTEAPLPVSVPPWWRVQKKHAMFYTGEGRGDHARLMMTAAILCTDSIDEARAIDAYAPDIRAYIASLRAPAYPFAIDQALAREGEAVFTANCSRCHGRYGESSQAHYPNLLVALDVVGTDPMLARENVFNGERFAKWYNGSFFGELAHAAPALGYYAPPLDGVWATAPYLHNGSVPSIAALLNSPTRPTYWKRTSLDSRDYDPQALGWNTQTLAHGKDGEPDWQQRKLIYDTTRPGYANSGHLFGDGLSKTERSAVLEYLKTL